MTDESKPRSRSHSQLNSFLGCGRQYELERLKKVPSRPQVAMPGGTAVHAVIERFLKEETARG